MFDRESEAGLRGYSVTIKAEDHGESQQLNTLCTFWVKIKDLNDNPPMFDTESYMQTVLRSTSVNKRIMGVLAVDKDKEMNAEVEYFLVDNPGEYFRVDSDTGGLYLQKSLSTIPVRKSIEHNIYIYLELKIENKTGRVEFNVRFFSIIILLV